MNNKIIMINLILQIQIIYCIFIQNYFKSFDGMTFGHVKKNLNNLQQDESKFLEFKDCIENSELAKNKILNELHSNYKFNYNEIKNYLDKKSYISYYIKNIQTKLVDFKETFTLIKNSKLWGVVDFTKFKDYRKFIKVIDVFLIKAEEIIEKFLSDPKNVKLKSLYKKYMQKLKLDKVNESLKKNQQLISNCINLQISEYQELSFFNKIEILQKINKLKNDSERKKDENRKFNYSKVYFDDCCNSISKINFKCKNIEIRLNDVLIEKIIKEYDKLKKIINRLEKNAELIDISLVKFNIISVKKYKKIDEDINNKFLDIEFVPKHAKGNPFYFDFTLKNPEFKKSKKLLLEIDLYKKNVNKFLSCLNTIFSLFNQEIGNKSKVSRDFGFLYFLQILKNVLLKPSKVSKIKSKPTFILKLFLCENLNNNMINEIKNKWLFSFYEYFFMKYYVNIIEEINYLCELNKIIFLEKNNSTF